MLKFSLHFAQLWIWTIRKLSLFFLIISQLHAEYDRESDDYNAHRVVQAFDTAQFIQQTRSDSCIQVLAGDLNTEPGDLAYRLLLVASGLRETYNETEHGPCCSNECSTNSYTPDSIKEIAPNGKRIDYILYRNGFNHQVNFNLFSAINHILRSKCTDFVLSSF